jgi:hypothetical protein
MDDTLELIIYIAIGIVGLLASAYRNKQKQKAQTSRIPRNITAESLPDVQPDLGPLAEIFGFPEVARPKPAEVQVADEPTVEEEGFLMDMPEPENMQPANAMEQEGMAMEKVDYEGMPVFKSTQETLISDSITESAITDEEGTYEPISASEIKGVEEEDKKVDNESINWRKAILYSEILQRRGN